VLAAIREEDEKRIRSSAPRAISALSRLIETPSQKNNTREFTIVLDHVHPADTGHKVDGSHQHDVTPNANETAQILECIAELSAKFSVRLPEPRVINGEAVETERRGPQ
jgi:hypothetical protein